MEPKLTHAQLKERIRENIALRKEARMMTQPPMNVKHAAQFRDLLKAENAATKRDRETTDAAGYIAIKTSVKS